MKRIAKKSAQALACVAAWPLVLRFRIHAALFGRARSCAAVSERASRWSGLFGQYVRRALFRQVLAFVGRDVVIGFGTILSKPSAELGDGVYIGSYCVLGDVRIGPDTLIADHVCIPSGSQQHGIDRLDVPVREQPGRYRTIHIGCDCWIGAGSVVLADVGDHCVVAAGSVVTRPVADYQIVAGNPARPIGDRRDRAAVARRCELVQAGCGG